MLEDYFLIIVSVAGAVGLGVLIAGLRNPLMFYYLALFGTAFLKTPELPVVREKLSIVEIFLALFWLSWALFAKGRVQRLVSPEAMRWGSAFCVVCLLSSVVAIGTAPAYLQNLKMTAFSLLEAGNYCYGVAILWTTVNVLDSWERWVGAILAWLAGMALAGTVGVAAMAGLAPGWAYEETGRICSTLKNENQVPSMVLPILLAGILAAVRRGVGLFWRLVLIGIVCAAILTAIGTGSRTAALMLMLSAGAAYWMMSGGQRAGRAVHLFYLSNLAVAFSIAVVFYFWIAWALYDGSYSLMKTPSWQRPAVLLIEWFSGERAIDSTRPVQIENALRYFWTSPILGTGPKFGSMFADTHGEVHNTYFSLLLETGFMGLGTFLPLIALAFLRGYQASEQCRYPWFSLLGKSLLVGLLLLCLYNATILGLRQRNIWFMLGMIFAFCDLVAAGVRPTLIPWRKMPRGLRAMAVDVGETPIVWQPPGAIAGARV